MTEPRLLIAGSRTWSDPWLMVGALNRALEHLGGSPTLIQGTANGADSMAAQLWSDAGRPVESHPAEWGQHSPECSPAHHGQPRCKSAGFRRNARMVELGADLCIAFIVGASKGASMTARMAERAGIETWRIDLAEGEQPHCFPAYGVHATPHRGCILR